MHGIETFDQNKIANGFNKFFTEIGSKHASSIPTSSKDFKKFINVSQPYKNILFKMKNYRKFLIV